jgi:nitroimidazol reductase NimA-like FMN-containing flavoprotein (pyridoxamine 5'-phosphate oxidase superfamily)
MAERNAREVSDPREIARIMSMTNVGRLATVGEDGMPYITPLNFTQMDGNIYFHSRPKGEKLRNMAKSPKVCFCIDVPLAYLDSPATGNPCDVTTFFHSVIVRGTASVVQDETKKLAALRALITRHEPDAEPEQLTPDSPTFKGCVVVEITPTSITGKSNIGREHPDELVEHVCAYLTQRNQPGDQETVEEIRLARK